MIGANTRNVFEDNWRIPTAFPDTQFLRAIAILMVVNSHLDRYYPVSHLATGGAIGNSLFFFLSAFGIYLSQQKKQKRFWEFISDRVGRIYPSLWVVLLLLVMPLMISSSKLTIDSTMDFVGSFFNPPYWFLQSLLVYYVLGYFLMLPMEGGKRKRLMLAYIAVPLVAYVLLYLLWVDLTAWSVEKTPFDRLHYFMMFIFGIVVARRNETVSYTGVHNYLILLALVFFVYLQKFVMAKGYLLELQFLQQAAMYPIVYYSLKVARSTYIVTKVMGFRGCSVPAAFLSAHTLEIYMIHETLNRPLLTLQLPFPFNVVLFVGLSMAGAAVVKWLSGLLQRKLDSSGNASPLLA